MQPPVCPESSNPSSHPKASSQTPPEDSSPSAAEAAGSPAPSNPSGDDAGEITGGALPLRPRNGDGATAAAAWKLPDGYSPGGRKPGPAPAGAENAPGVWCQNPAVEESDAAGGGVGSEEPQGVEPMDIDGTGEGSGEGSAGGSEADPRAVLGVAEEREEDGEREWTVQHVSFNFHFSFGMLRVAI